MSELGMNDLSLSRWLPDRAALTPDRVAIDFGGRLISYAELAGAAAARAAAFAALGLKPGDRVATLARNCPEQVAVFFACAQAGLILVPLNWRLMAAELAYQIGDSDPAVLLTDPALEALGKEAALSACRVESLLTEPAPAEAAPEVAVSGEDPLLILYTSGTTGRPKGAVLTHANCFWTNLSLDRTAEITGGDVVLQVLPQCHVGGWNVQPLLAWWKGATVVLEQAFDAARVLDLIQEKKIATMMGVPTNYQMLAARPEFGQADLSSLRRVIGVPDERWGETGLAFVVFAPGQETVEAELAEFCRERLARYKVPGRFRVLAELPRVTSGKIDKVSLRSMLEAGE